MSKKVSQPRIFEIGSVVEHPVYGRCTVTHYYKGTHKPYDIREEENPRMVWAVFKKDLTLAGPRPPEIYEEWFR